MNPDCNQATDSFDLDEVVKAIDTWNAHFGAEHNRAQVDARPMTFEQWWNEIENFGLRAERFTTPDDAARAAWDQAMSVRAQADARPVGFVEQREFENLKKGAVARLFPTNDDRHDVAVYTHPEASAPGLIDTEELADVVSKAMRRAWYLGQTYWQQADSEYFSQNRKSDETQAKYQILVDETRATILTRASAATVAEPSDVAVLPDGSEFSVVSMPLPKDHWLYAERTYEKGGDDPDELPAPLLTHAERDSVVSAIRYAVRGATMCGKESDFDPDALVQNAVYALCGPFTRTLSMGERIGRATEKSAQQQAEPSDIIKRQAQMIAELIADRDSWIEAHARLYRLYHEKAAQQQTNQGASHEWDATGERCLKCGDKDWFAGSTCSGKAAQQQAEPGADERAAFEAWASKRRMDLRREANNPDEYLLASTADACVGWLARAAQSGQRAGVPTYRCSNVNVKSLSDGNVMVTMLAKAFEPAPEYDVQPVNPAVVRSSDQAGQRAGVAEGWQLVPIEPTNAMLSAFHGAINRGDAWDSAYAAMLAAAPTQQQEGAA